MSGIVPPKKPQDLTKPQAVQLLARHGVSVSRAPALLGLRGYYKRTMGDPGRNDRGIYDDAMFLVSPRSFIAFNANVDPSKYAPGIATLADGAWAYKLGTHHPGTPGAYECLVQAAPVTVHRDGKPDETGEFYIHIHRGGVQTTSSLGCQTIPPDQWDDFLFIVKGEMKAAEVSRIVYVLAEAP